jgi:hypothetical protein
MRSWRTLQTNANFAIDAGQAADRHESPGLLFRDWLLEAHIQPHLLLVEADRGIGHFAVLSHDDVGG